MSFIRLRPDFIAAHDNVSVASLPALDLSRERGAEQLSGEVTEQDVRNVDARLRHEEEENMLQGQLSGSVAGVTLASAAAAMRETANAKDAAERKAASDRYLQLLLDQIAELDRKIEWYDGEIARLKTEVGEMDQLSTAIGNGTLDPNDPRTAALMDKYGITPEDLANGGQAALDKLRAAREGHIETITQHSKDRDKYQAEKDELTEKLENEQTRQQALDHGNMDALLEARQTSSTDVKSKINTAVEAREDKGAALNHTKDADSDAFSALSDLGEPETESRTSVAAQETPDAGIAGNGRDVRGDFKTAALGETPAATADNAVDRELTKTASVGVSNALQA